MLQTLVGAIDKLIPQYRADVYITYILHGNLAMITRDPYQSSYHNLGLSFSCQPADYLKLRMTNVTKDLNLYLMPYPIIISRIDM